MTDAIYTLAGAAQKVQLSEKTLRRCIASGELRASKLRGAYRIRAEWLDEWLEENVVQPDSFAVVPLSRPRRKRTVTQPALARAGSLRAVLEDHTKREEQK